MTYVLMNESNEKIEVSKIIAVGRNYKKHIEELNSIELEEPVLFLKPTTAILHENGVIKHPKFSKDMHHEVELAIVISKKGKNIPKEKANEYILGYGVAIDLTLRDIQSEAKKNGTPWSIAKGFDTSMPISKIYKYNSDIDLNNMELSLFVNGVQKQKSSTSLMIYNVESLIALASKYFTLLPGDIILTGTPEGVGKLNIGDEITIYLENISAKFTVGEDE